RRRFPLRPTIAIALLLRQLQVCCLLLLPRNGAHHERGLPVAAWMAGVRSGSAAPPRGSDRQPASRLAWMRVAHRRDVRPVTSLAPARLATGTESRRASR